ncbi:DUF1289 domain-containing protein [Bosea sp. (in: a-proteobacteria)]|uniref:DUF1289 domain-containing protein n=1 Tax=Bosea sp. (in: a-proteobacteria) TaxID=1871050 RepID=UPI003A5CF985
MTAISSPCIKLCQLDPATRLCLGCGRSLNEIGRWSNLSEAERRAIMTELPARLGARKSVGAP